MCRALHSLGFSGTRAITREPALSMLSVTLDRKATWKRSETHRHIIACPIADRLRLGVFARPARARHDAAPTEAVQLPIAGVTAVLTLGAVRACRTACRRPRVVERLRVAAIRIAQDEAAFPRRCFSCAERRRRRYVPVVGV